MALYHSSIEWFETRFRKLIPKGLPSSYKQLKILTDLLVAHLDEAATRRNTTILHFTNTSRNHGSFYNVHKKTALVNLSFLPVALEKFRLCSFRQLIYNLPDEPISPKIIGNEQNHRIEQLLGNSLIILTIIR